MTAQKLAIDLFEEMQEVVGLPELALACAMIAAREVIQAVEVVDREKGHLWQEVFSELKKMEV